MIRDKRSKVKANINVNDGSWMRDNKHYIINDEHYMIIIQGLRMNDEWCIANDKW